MLLIYVIRITYMSKQKFTAAFAEQLVEFLGALVEAKNTFYLPRYKGFSYSRFRFPHSRLQVRKGFANLQARAIIRKTDNEQFELTKKGSRWLRSFYYRYFQHRYRTWDKKWRLVIFDIPRTMNKERVKLLRSLKLLGFKMLQESIFVLPYPCQEEIGDICSRLNLTDYVDLVVAESIGSREDDFKREFDV